MLSIVAVNQIARVFRFHPIYRNSGRKWTAWTARSPASILTQDSRAPVHLSLLCELIVAEPIDGSTGADVSRRVNNKCRKAGRVRDAQKRNQIGEAKMTALYNPKERGRPGGQLA